MKQLTKYVFAVAVLAVLLLPVWAGSTGGRRVGDSGYVRSRVICAQTCVLREVTGYCSSASNEFIMIFNTTSLPTNGAKAVWSFPVGAGQYFSRDWGAYGISMDGVTVASSSTADTLTITATNCAFQGVVEF